MQLVENFLGKGICRGREKCSLSQLFRRGTQLIWEIVVVGDGVVIKEEWERIIFGGEDGFIIKENFEFVKNGKKDGQKGQGRKIRYVKHKEF